MTKAADLWTRYQEYTSDLTEFSRKLGFAAAGICWLLKAGERFPAMVLLALAALVGYFLLDIVQRLWAAVRQKRFMEARERAYFLEHGNAMPSDHQIVVPAKLDAPIYRVFLWKIGFLLATFILIGAEIVQRSLG